MSAWNRCDECGRFIPLQDFAEGKALHRLMEPDSDLGNERLETLCHKHVPVTLLTHYPRNSGYDVLPVARENVISAAEYQIRQVNESLKAENERLREALELAREHIAYWGSFASEYCKNKSNLAGNLAEIDAALAVKL